jgi:hypothetical protein
LREDFLNGRRRMGIGGRGIVAAECFHLGADDALDRGHIVNGAGRGSEADKNYCKQEDAHEGTPGWFSLHRSYPTRKEVSRQGSDLHCLPAHRFDPPRCRCRANGALKTDAPSMNS